jgi:hypothetical protein
MTLTPPRCLFIFVVEWEGPEAVEDRTNLHIDPALLSHVPDSPKRFILPDEPEESSDDGSEDDYVADEEKRKGKVRLLLFFFSLSFNGLFSVPNAHTYSQHKHKFDQRRANIASSDSEDLSDGGTKVKVVTRHAPARRPRRPAALSVSTKTRSASGSPGVHSPAVKRRKSTASSHEHVKRKRSESVATTTPGGAGIDAARKYCVTKLQEIFVGIFTRYPMLQEPEDEDELVVVSSKEGLTPEEKERLEEKGRRFASELEECLFETYSEPEAKTGHHAVGMKYKYVLWLFYSLSFDVVI